ncbi:MAG: hypothetical protein ACYTBW_05260 [Planctomycetota bacterium]|jgi:Tfp pilus assembly ATPase PilU
MSDQPLGDPIEVKAKKPPEIEKLFRVVIKSDASDLHLKVGLPPKIRIHSKLKNTTGEPLTEEKIENLVFEIMSEKQKKFFASAWRLAGSVASFRHLHHFMFLLLSKKFRRLMTG